MNIWVNGKLQGVSLEGFTTVVKEFGKRLQMRAVRMRFDGILQKHVSLLLGAARRLFCFQRPLPFWEYPNAEKF